jgi:hypothetical protein
MQNSYSYEKCQTWAFMVRFKISPEGVAARMWNPGVSVSGRNAKGRGSRDFA